MKGSRLPRLIGATRPLPVFSPSELARKRLRHLSGSSSGSSTNLPESPTKSVRVDAQVPVFHQESVAPTTSKARPKNKTRNQNKTKSRPSALNPAPDCNVKTPPTASVTPPPAPTPPVAPQRPPRKEGNNDDDRTVGNGTGTRAPSPEPSTSAAASVASQPEPCGALDGNDGFTLVSKKKKGKKGRKTEATADVPNPQAENSPLPEQRTTPTPRPSATQGNSAPRPRNAPSTIRPTVSVARPQPPPSDFPAFRVPAQEGFATSYDAVAVLEEKHPLLNMRNIIGRDGSSVLVPLNQETFATLEAVASDPAEAVKLTLISPDTQLSKGVVMGYPLRMPLSLLQRHPQVEQATRCVSSRLKENTRQVIISVRGTLPPHIDLGNWGVFYTRPYTPEPLRCFRCHRFGHHQANCSRPHVCGICSGRHATQECLDKFKAKLDVTHKCPNCGGKHHAWNPSCPTRIQRVNAGRERQAEWVQEKQRSALVPAPPGTFVWGSQQQRNPVPPQATPLEEDFPTLQEATGASPPPQQRTGPQQPLSPGTTSHTTPPPPPPQPCLPPGSIVITQDLLRDFAKQLTQSVAQVIMHVSGASFDLHAFEEVMTPITDNITSQIVEKAQEMAHAESQDKQKEAAAAPKSAPRPPQHQMAEASGSASGTAAGSA